MRTGSPPVCISAVEMVKEAARSIPEMVVAPDPARREGNLYRTATPKAT